MKLARAIINEVLNSRNTGLIQFNVRNRTEMDGYYTLNSLRPRATKVIIPYKGDKYRPIEIQTKMYMRSSMSPFGEDGSVQHFLVGKFQDQLQSDPFNSKALTTIKVKKDHGWITKEKFYLWLIKEGLPNSVVGQFFPDLADLEVEETVIKQGDVSFIGFDEKKHKALLDFFDKAETTLKKVGFKDLVYGKVFLVPRKNAGMNVTLADYVEKDDTMRVFDLAQKNNDTLQTIIHELGHRLYRKRLSADAYRSIRERYAKAIADLKTEVTTGSKATLFTVGQRFHHPKFGELEYGGLGGQSLYSNKKSYKFYILKDGQRTNRYLPFKTLEEATIHFSSLESSNKASGKKTDNAWMPTSYAMTKDTEWFAEVFSFAVMDNNKEVLDWVKGLL